LRILQAEIAETTSTSPENQSLNLRGLSQALQSLFRSVLYMKHWPYVRLGFYKFGYGGA